MKKIIILSTFLYAHFAFAQVELYGDLKSGIETSQTRVGKQRFSHSQISDLDSHIGIRGSYPIGGGNHLMWQLGQETPVGQERSDSIRQQWRNRKSGGESFIGIGR